jgi:hypothetical protein
VFFFTNYQFLIWGPVLLIVGNLSTMWLVVCVVNHALMLTASTRTAFELSRKRSLILLPIIFLLVVIMTGSAILIRDFVIYYNGK